MLRVKLFSFKSNNHDKETVNCSSRPQGSEDSSCFLFKFFELLLPIMDEGTVRDV